MPEGRRPRGVTPRPRSGAAAESARLQWCRNGGEELPKSEVRGGGREEVHRVQGQEWWLHFSGAALKRDLMFKVRGTQVRQ